jgi:predicted RNA binding protein YcfA (HicA-like mRNA interferase family)
MPELRGFSGKSVIAILVKMGFVVQRTQGSHTVLHRGEAVCVVPLHSELAVGVLRSVLRQAGVSPGDFLTNSVK